MSNYTKPDDKNYEDKPEDWLFCSLLFSGALGFLLKPGRAIFLKLSGDELKIHPEIKYVIVWNDGKNMAMHDASDRTDLKEGDHIIMIEEKDLPNAN
jgi:hypothetical protein